MESLNDGVIESDYRGIVMILMINHSDQEFGVDIGQRFAQIVLQKNGEVTFTKFIEIEDTERGMGGFRSTGVY